MPCPYPHAPARTVSNQCAAFLRPSACVWPLFRPHISGSQSLPDHLLPAWVTQHCPCLLSMCVHLIPAGKALCSRLQLQAVLGLQALNLPSASNQGYSVPGCSGGTPPSCYGNQPLTEPLGPQLRPHCLLGAFWDATVGTAQVPRLPSPPLGAALGQKMGAGLQWGSNHPTYSCFLEKCIQSSKATSQ